MNRDHSGRNPGKNRLSLFAGCKGLLISGLLMIFTLHGVSAGALNTEGQKQTFREYAVKAAYLYNFAKFVEWPAGQLPEQSLPLTICIYGKDPFGNAIDIIRDKTVNGRMLQVVRSRTVERLAGCHVTFVSSSEKRHLSALLRKFGDMHMLTVSDIDDFAHKGGMIGLISAQGKIQLEINLDAAQRSGLKVSSKLLNISKVIRVEKRER